MIRLVAPRFSPSEDLCFFGMSRQLGEFPYKFSLFRKDAIPVETITSNVEGFEAFSTNEQTSKLTKATARHFNTLNDPSLPRSALLDRSKPTSVSSKR
jgi:hypothetical protein